jgi:hypothetical protein
MVDLELLEVIARQGSSMSDDSCLILASTPKDLLLRAR